jgi:hypothetical protein
MATRDVFICHASGDKETHARPLFNDLGRRGVSCWLDEGNLRPGDSLMAGINDGLAKAQVVALLLTPQFLGRRWPEREMAAALSLEMAGRTKVVPVLDVSREELEARYPLFADSISLAWSSGIPHVADELANLFSRQPNSEWVFTHDKTYVGPIWTRITPRMENHAAAHDITIRWGLWQWKGRVVPSHEPTSLTHFKERADEYPMWVQVEPSAIVTVGQGPPPDAQYMDINEGWVRPSGWAPTQAERILAREEVEQSDARIRWHERLRAEYVATHDEVPAGIAKGDEPLPQRWLERRAIELGLSDLLGLS